MVEQNDEFERDIDCSSEEPPEESQLDEDAIEAELEARLLNGDMYSESEFDDS